MSKYIDVAKLYELTKAAKDSALRNREQAGDDDEMRSISGGAYAAIKQLEISVGQMEGAYVKPVSHSGWYQIQAFMCRDCCYLSKFETKHCPNCGAEMFCD